MIRLNSTPLTRYDSPPNAAPHKANPHFLKSASTFLPSPRSRPRKIFISRRSRTFSTCTQGNPRRAEATTSSILPFSRASSGLSLNYNRGLLTLRPQARAKTIRGWNSKRSFSSKAAKGASSSTGQRVNGSSHETLSFDILIVGGGMVGTALAAALGTTPGTSSLKVGLIELEGFPSLENMPSTPELRVSAINHASVALFKAIGVWDIMTSTGRVASFQRMQVWDATGPGQIQFQNDQIENNEGTKELGYIIENRVIQGALYKQLQSLSNTVHILPKCSIESINFANTENNTINSINGPTPEDKSPNNQRVITSDDWVELRTKQGQLLRTALLVGADGANSMVRDYAQISTHGWAYNQRGLVTTVSHPKPNTIAWQRFLPGGPIALLPMFGNYSNIVWSLPPSKAEQLVSLSKQPELLLQQIKSALIEPLRDRGWGFSEVWNRYTPQLPPSISVVDLPEISAVVGNAASFPLNLRTASQYVKPRVALIGDAGHTVHPLAGQGVNLGLADACTLATVLVEGVESGQDVGQMTVLQQYEEQRMTANMIMMAGIDGLKRLFDNSFFPIAFARNLGLNLTNVLTPLKNGIVKYATGENIDVSKLGPKRYTNRASPSAPSSVEQSTTGSSPLSSSQPPVTTKATV